MMPDAGSWGDAPSFLHELVDMGEQVRIPRCISTTARRSVNLAGVSKMKLYSTGQQLMLRGRSEARRIRIRSADEDEDEASA